MEVTTEYYYTLPTEDTEKFFKVGSWYKGKDGDKGIVAKSTGNPEHNPGWWSGAEFIARLISPQNWEEITDQKEIDELENKLSSHKLEELWKVKQH